MAEENIESRLTNEFSDSILSDVDSKIFSGEYGGSNYQLTTYKKVEMQDKLYQNYIKKNYGSFENYLNSNQMNQMSSVYNPVGDYRADIKIVTDKYSFTSDHISTSETIMEILSGVCTVYFLKKTNSNIRRITCSLNEEHMPTSEYSNRSNFFSAMPGDRVGVWDINEQKWKSFYMDSLVKFVRDETVSTE